MVFILTLFGFYLNPAFSVGFSNSVVEQIVDSFFESFPEQRDVTRDEMVKSLSCVPSDMLEAYEEDPDMGVFYISMALRKKQPVWMPFLYPSLITAYQCKNDPEIGMADTELDAVFGEFIEHSDNFREAVCHLDCYQGLDEKKRVLVTSLLFHDLDYKKITSTLEERYYFKMKFKGYLELVRKYPDHLRYENFKVFLDNVPNEIVKSWAEYWGDFEKSIPEVMYHMGLTDAPDKWDVAPGDVTREEKNPSLKKVRSRREKEVKVFAGRKENRYWLTTKVLSPGETPDDYMLEPRLDVIDQATSDRVKTRTVSLIDCGVFDADQLSRLKFDDVPEGRGLLEGLESCRVIIHLQVLPEAGRFSGIMLNPGRCFGEEAHAVKVGFSGIHLSGLNLHCVGSSARKPLTQFVYNPDQPDQGCSLCHGPNDISYAFDMTSAKRRAEGFSGISIVRQVKERKRNKGGKVCDAVLTIHRLYSRDVDALQNIHCPSPVNLPCQIAGVAWGEPERTDEYLALHQSRLAPATADENDRFDLLEVGQLLVHPMLLNGLFARSGIIDYCASMPDYLLDSVLSHVKPYPDIRVVADDADDVRFQGILKPIRDCLQLGDFEKNIDWRGIIQTLESERFIAFPSGDGDKIIKKLENLLEEARGQARPDYGKIEWIYMEFESYIRMLAVDMVNQLNGDCELFRNLEVKKKRSKVVNDEFDLVFTACRMNRISEEHQSRLEEFDDEEEIYRERLRYQEIHRKYNKWKLKKMKECALQKNYSNHLNGFFFDAKFMNEDPADALLDFQELLIRRVGDSDQDLESRKGEVEKVVMDAAFDVLSEKDISFLPEDVRKKVEAELNSPAPDKAAVIERICENLGDGWQAIVEEQ